MFGYYLKLVLSIEELPIIKEKVIEAGTGKKKSFITVKKKINS